MRFLKALALALALVAPASAQTYFRTYLSTTTGYSTMTMPGILNLAASSITANSPTIILNGVTGAITAGAWQGTAVGTQYGGTGQNFSGTAQGSLTYFSATGVVSALAPGTAGNVLQSGGAAANPSWLAQSSITAGKATNLAGGAANQIPFQTAPNTTSFGALTGTANEITVTPPLTIGGGGQNVTCASNQALLAATYNHGIPTGGSCTTVALASPNNPQPSWQGINYVTWMSSGPVMADSTATFSFNVEASSVVFEGALYNVPKQNFAVIASTYTLISWNPTNGYRQWGLKDFMPPTLSSMTATLKDDLVVALSSSDANGVISLFESVWASPLPGFFFSGEGSTAFTNLTSGQIAPFFDCRIHPPYSLGSCDTNFVTPVFTGPRGFQFTLATSLTQADPNKWCAILNNTSGGSANMFLYEPSGGTGEAWVTVDGVQPGTLNNANRTPKPVSIGTGYHPVCLYVDITAGAQYNVKLYFPQNVNIVRGGEW